MARYAWRAARADGQPVSGFQDGANEQAVHQYLVTQGFVPLAIAPSDQVPDAAARTNWPGAARPRTRKGPPNQADVLALTTELAIMLRAGVALDRALRVMVSITEKPSMQAILSNLLEAVKGGAPFSRALVRHGELFSDFYVNMVRSGESSGQLAPVLTRLADHLQRLKTLRENAVSAMMYPAILLTVAVLSVAAMMGFVVPQFEKLFAGLGDALPLPTRTIMWLAALFRDYGIWLAIAAVAAFGLFRKQIFSTASKRRIQRLALRTPILGALLVKYDLTLYAKSLGTLLDNGVPILRALDIATSTVGNALLRDVLSTVAPHVKEGGKLTHALATTGVFEALALNLIRVGEETGRLGAMMGELAGVFDRDVEVGIRRLLTLLEPALILVLGILIAAIIVSILLGILAVNDLAL